MCIAIILVISLSLTVSDISKASDSKQLAGTKNPFRIVRPYSVAMEEWTDVLRSLRKEMDQLRTAPEKPFRFKLNRKLYYIVDL